MQTKLYVGNLSYNATDKDLQALFEKCGAVQTVDIIRDRYTGQAKGFAFVEMSNQEEAKKALELNGTDFMGRNLNVSEARPQERRGSKGFGGGHDRQRRDGFGSGQKKGSNWKW